MVFLYHYIETIRRNINLVNLSKIRAREQSYSHIDRYVTENLKHFHQSTLKYLNNPDSIAIEEIFFNSINNIKALIKKLYYTLESHFTDAIKLDLEGKRIDFEVTFMTKSYKDNYITIPACNNRENRSPRSMVLREKNPEIYENTVTAEIYKMDRPSMKIIEDTNSVEYHELYSGQKERIRSSIVYPVLSDNNELLGTIVLHCNRPNFFLEKDKHYWRELIEVFSKRIALEKIKLDAINNGLSGKSFSILGDKPF